MRNQIRWNIYFSNRLWKPRLWNNLKINFLMRRNVWPTWTRKNWNEKIQEMRNVFFWRGRGRGRRANDRKTMENVGEGERRRSRFTFYEVNWMGSPLPLPSSCRKIAYNDGGGTEPMEAQNGYYLGRRRHSWLSFWFTSCPLDLILASTTRSTPFPPNDWPFEFSGYDERN